MNKVFICAICVICGFSSIACTQLDRVGTKANYSAVYEIAAEARAYRHADGSIQGITRTILDKRDLAAVKNAGSMANAAGNEISEDHTEIWLSYSRTLYLTFCKRILKWAKEKGLAPRDEEPEGGN